jgi:DNA-binding beta-propeller fold protein YncE
MLAGGDAAAAAAALEEALSLWRGRPLAEFEASPFALVESLRLEELRISVIEDRVEADLALGRHAAMIPELETLVAEHPHDERLCGYLMLALYRSGRQAEALAAYQRTRHALVDELGIEPGTMLQQLERAILNHEPSLELPHDADRGSESADAVLVEPRAQMSRRVFIVGALGALAAGLGLAFALRGGEPAPILLRPNSVGFIDAGSNRVTRRFRVGRDPRALVVANRSVWVANYLDRTVTHIDLESRDLATIPVGGHPTGLASYRGSIWVTTLEGRVVPIDTRFDSAKRPIDLGRKTPGGIALADIAAGGGFLWITSPGTTVFRLDPADPLSAEPIYPDEGAEGPIAYGAGQVWVAGSGQVFPIPSESDIPRTGPAVGGIVRDVAVSRGSVWVLSGGPFHSGGLPGLRRIDPNSRLIDSSKIPVGPTPGAVAATGDAIWVASRDGGDGAVYRVDPRENRVLDTITVRAIPTAVAADADGVWVAAK